MTFIAMAAEAKKKLEILFQFRSDEDLAKSVSELMAKHKVADKSEYFRGLVYLDAVLARESTASLNKPKWISQAFPALFAEPVGFIPRTPVFDSPAEAINESQKTEEELLANARNSGKRKRKAG